MNIKQTGKSLKKLRKKQPEILYEFSDNEELTRCIIALYQNEGYRNLQSSIYKINGYYQLIVKNSDQNFSTLICEFSTLQTKCTLIINKTKEYGKKLIGNRAIKRYGEIFNQKT